MRELQKVRQTVRTLLIALWIPALCAGIPVSAKLLEVGIEHSEILAPVDQSLQPGQIFRTRAEKSSEPDRWALIPRQTAGQWKLLRKFDVSTVDLKTGQRTIQPADRNGNSITYGNSVTYIGYQTDGGNRVWTSADIESKLPHSNGTYLIPAQWELTILNDHSFSTIKRGVSVSVDPRSNRIQDAKQLETFATFEVVASNVLLQKYSTKWFNANGEAIKLTEGQTEMQRTGEFEPVNDLNGIDVKGSFRRFLRARKSQPDE